MCTPDFQSPMKTELLWVYEGLGEYLGELLMVRSGLAEPGEYREMLAWTLGDLIRRDGRRWRSLEDTAVAGNLLRGPSPNWNDLRRGQDYYQEGALIWLEADAIIRDVSHGERSLDDFCKRFLGPSEKPGKVVPYDRAEIVAILKELADQDWAAFFDRRVSSPLDALPLDAVARCGYRVGYASKPSGYLEYLQKKGAWFHLGPRFPRPDAHPRRQGDQRQPRHGRRPCGRPARPCRSLESTAGATTPSAF